MPRDPKDGGDAKKRETTLRLFDVITVNRKGGGFQYMTSTVNGVVKSVQICQTVPHIEGDRWYSYDRSILVSDQGM